MKSRVLNLFKWKNYKRIYRQVLDVLQLQDELFQYYKVLQLEDGDEDQCLKFKKKYNI